MIKIDFLDTSTRLGRIRHLGLFLFWLVIPASCLILGTKVIPENIPDNFFIEMVELEIRLSELFQIEVLGQDFMKDVVPARDRFSFKDYLAGNSGFPENYLGTRLLYNQKFNIKDD